MNSINKSYFTIECKDVILQEFKIEDLDDFHALTWQPEIYEFLPGWNVSKELREDWFLHFEIPENQEFLKAVSEKRDVGELRLRLGIILRETGKFIGWCCTGIKAELPPPNREIVYGISNEYRGKGYTTQAVQGLLTFLFQHTNIEVINAIALERNLPSNRVIQKSGFNFQNKIQLENETYDSYKLTKNDWVTRR